jgi:hypothetical protein
MILAAYFKGALIGTLLSKIGTLMVHDGTLQQVQSLVGPEGSSYADFTGPLKSPKRVGV